MLGYFLFIKSRISYPLHAVLSKCFSIKSQKGVTMIEYGLIAALVAVVAIVAIKAIGTNAATVFNKISNSL